MRSRRRYGDGACAKDHLIAKRNRPRQGRQEFDVT